MRLLNFSHPIPAAQRAELAALLQIDLQELTVQDVPTQVEHADPLEPQVVALVEKCALTPEQWQTEPLIINPPGLAVVAVALTAELHGRMGYFAPVLRLRPVAGITPPRFEVAAVINLQAIRDDSRRRR